MNEKLRTAQRAALSARADADGFRVDWNVAERVAWMAELRVRQNPEDELAARRALTARRKADEAEAEFVAWDTIAWEAEHRAALLLAEEEEEEWYARWEEN